MARARKSHAPDEEKTKTRLEPPYGSCGNNPYVVYCDLHRDGEEHARVLVLNFKAKYAAAFMLSKLLNGDTWEECDPIGSRKGVITASGIRITMPGDDLLMLLEYEPTEAEAEWRDEQVAQWVLRFKYGSVEGGKKRDEEDQDDQGDAEPDSPEREGDRDVPSKGRGDKPKRQPKEPKPAKPKFDTSGYVSANDIAAQLKVEGREVRGVLRSMKLEKPAHGWSWPKDEAAKIKEKVSVALKEGKAKKK